MATLVVISRCAVCCLLQVTRWWKLALAVMSKVYNTTFITAIGKAQTVLWNDSLLINIYLLLSTQHSTKHNLTNLRFSVLTPPMAYLDIFLIHQKTSFKVKSKTWWGKSRFFWRNWIFLTQNSVSVKYTQNDTLYWRQIFNFLKPEKYGDVRRKRRGRERF